MSLRRTGLARKSELARSPLRRKKALARVAAAKRMVGKQQSQAARRRDTGPGTEVKALVWARARGRCEVCRGDVQAVPFGHSFHHRQPRGMGGSRAEWMNSPANLLLLCGSGTTGCHGMVERNRQAAYDAGWLVFRAEHPAHIPVLVTGGRTVYLTEQGEYAEGAP